MKTFIKIIPIILLGVLLPLTNSMAENSEFGEVIEVSQNHDFIQVRDKIFKIDTVFIDNGEKDADLLNDGKHEINEGDVVQVFIGNSHGDYWIADKIILFRGKGRTQIIKEAEIELIYTEEHTIQQKPKPEPPKQKSKVLLKDGIWRN